MPRFNILPYVQVRRAVRDLIQACNAVPDDPASAFAFAIGELNEARPKPPQGRPQSRQANGSRIRRFREKAGLTRPELLDAVQKRRAQDAFCLKTLQRYENSSATSPAILEAIAAVLAKKLGRAITVEDLT